MKTKFPTTREVRFPTTKLCLVEKIEMEHLLHTTTLAVIVFLLDEKKENVLVVTAFDLGSSLFLKKFFFGNAPNMLKPINTDTHRFVFHLFCFETRKEALSHSFVAVSY